MSVDTKARLRGNVSPDDIINFVKEKFGWRVRTGLTTSNYEIPDSGVYENYTNSPTWDTLSGFIDLIVDDTGEKNRSIFYCKSNLNFHENYDYYSENNPELIEMVCAETTYISLGHNEQAIEIIGAIVPSSGCLIDFIVPSSIFSNVRPPFNKRSVISFNCFAFCSIKSAYTRISSSEISKIWLKSSLVVPAGTLSFTLNKSVLPTNSSTVLTPSSAIYSRSSCAINRIKLMTYSGLPLKFLRSSGFCVATPTGQVSKLHTRIITQPIVTNGAVAKPNSSAPNIAAIATSLPSISLPSVSMTTLERRPFNIND